MKTMNDAMAQSIINAARIVLWFTEDLKPDEYLHRPCAKANCAAWTVGHLILAGRMMTSRFAASDLLPLPEGFEAAYARDEQAPSAAKYPHIDGLRELFQQTHDRLAEAVRKLPAERFDEKLPKPTPMFDTLGGLAAFAPVHIATHAGQISTIRRSLGRSPLI
ncbi:MAG TPA: DinB family protein [Pirellulales bacterium]|nr:DinB family protein [Pirellulales bacterium]